MNESDLIISHLVISTMPPLMDEKRRGFDKKLKIVEILIFCRNAKAKGMAPENW